MHVQVYLILEYKSTYKKLSIISYQKRHMYFKFPWQRKIPIYIKNIY